MDLAELKARAQAAREFQVSIGECSFTLRTPTRLELREVLLRRGVDLTSSSPLILSLVQYYLLTSFLIGWTGPRDSHVVPDAGDAPLAWSVDAVPLLLDAQPEWADTLGAKLLASVSDRSDRIGEEAKNSGST